MVHLLPVIFMKTLLTSDLFIDGCNLITLDFEFVYLYAFMFVQRRDKEETAKRIKESN